MSLNEPIKALEKSSNGISLKESTVSLLNELMADSDFTAGNIFGYSVGDFVTKEFLTATYNSINSSLEYVLNKSLSGSIYSSLTAVSECKDSVRNAVNDLCGRTVIPSSGEGSFFELYPDLIHSIPDLSIVRILENVEASENGEYESDDGKAYGSISVNVPEKTLTTRAITSNGTYYAQQDGADGYEWVQVSVTGNIPTFTVRFWSEDRQNILYTALNVPYGGYAQFDSTYPEHEGLYFTGWNPSPTNVTSDMECYPVFSDVPTGSNEITDSWNTIVANHGSGYPLGSWKWLQLSEFSSSLNWPLIPEYSVCIPRLNSSWYISACADESTIGQSGMDYYVPMIKVATGEGGSSSTWLCVNPLYINIVDYYSGSTTTYKEFYASAGTNQNKAGFNWKASSLRTFLNEEFIKAFPSNIKNAIIAVPKYSCGLIDDDYSQVASDIQTRDKIWVPSVRELLYGVTGLSSTVAYRKTMDNVSLGMTYSNVLFPNGTNVAGENVWKNFVSGEKLSYGGYWATRDTARVSYRTCVQITPVSDGNNSYNITVPTVTEYNTNTIPTSSSTFAGRLIFGFCL